jgi:hypothetical protein
MDFFGRRDAGKHLDQRTLKDLQKNYGKPAESYKNFIERNRGVFDDDSQGQKFETKYQNVAKAFDKVYAEALKGQPVTGLEGKLEELEKLAKRVYNDCISEIQQRIKNSEASLKEHVGQLPSLQDVKLAEKFYKSAQRRAGRAHNYYEKRVVPSTNKLGAMNQRAGWYEYYAHKLEIEEVQFLIELRTLKVQEAQSKVQMLQEEAQEYQEKLQEAQKKYQEVLHIKRALTYIEIYCSVANGMVEAGPLADSVRSSSGTDTKGTDSHPDIEPISIESATDETSQSAIVVREDLGPSAQGNLQRSSRSLEGTTRKSDLSLAEMARETTKLNKEARQRALLILRGKEPLGHLVECLNESRELAHLPLPKSPEESWLLPSTASYNELILHLMGIDPRTSAH